MAENPSEAPPHDLYPERSTPQWLFIGANQIRHHTTTPVTQSLHFALLADGQCAYLAYPRTCWGLGPSIHRAPVAIARHYSAKPPTSRLGMPSGPRGSRLVLLGAGIDFQRAYEGFRCAPQSFYVHIFITNHGGTRAAP